MENLEEQVIKDIENAKIRFRKPNRVVKLYDSFFDNFEELLNVAKKQSINKEYDNLAATFHNLKGASSNIGMSLISTLVINLEASAKKRDENIDYIKDIYTLKMYGKLYQDTILQI